MSLISAEASPQARAQPGRSTLIIASVLGLVVSVSLVWLALRRVDLHSSKDALAAIRWWPWIPLAVTSYLLGHLVRGYRCAALLRGQASIGSWSATNVVIAGYAGNNVLPARLGELVRVGLLSTRTGLPIWQALSLTALERVVDGIAILLLLTLASINTASSSWISSLTQVAGTVLGTAALGLLSAVLWPSLPITLASRVGAKFGPRAHDALVRFAGQLTAGVKPLRRPQVAVAFVAASLLVWTLEAGMFVALFPAFGLPADFWNGALVMGVTNLGLLAPSTPGFVGTFHAFCAAALETQGLDPSTAMSFAVVAHLTFFVPVTIWGALVLLVSGMKLGSTIRDVRAAREAGQVRIVNGVELHLISSEPASRAAAAPSSFMVSLIESLVARSDRAEDIDRRALVIATEFTVGQLAALSELLQAAFAVGMTMFRTWVLLRYLGRFERLPLQRRRQAAESWAYGPFALFRMLFKPVRGVALLAYFESKVAS